MLKPLFRLSLVCLLTAVFAGVALAQQAEPGMYVSVSYIKVLPGQDEAYRAYLTTTGKKVFQEMMNANPNFIAWSSARVMYQGMEHGSDFDYVGASVYSGPPPEPGANTDAVIMKAAGMSQADLGKKLATMRTIVGTEILRRRAGTSAAATGVMKEGDFRVVARVKIKPNMADEYYDMAASIIQPLNAARVANGELKGWSVWARVFPSGAATAYDALTVTYFKDQASAIKGLDSAKGAETFLKVHPGKNFGTFVNNVRDYSDMQQRLLMQVISVIERGR
jgi:hypothetical protein